MARKTAEERFWEKVDVRGKDECWEWGASKIKGGYGRFRVGGRMLLSHRFSWELHSKNKIPEGLVVMHSCDNTSCVNPFHLSVGTHLDNMDDQKRKGRVPSGKDHHSFGKTASSQTKKKMSEFRMGKRSHRTTLSDGDVLEIRRLWETGEYEQKELAKMFRVQSGNICKIVNRKSWRHI